MIVLDCIHVIIIIDLSGIGQKLLHFWLSITRKNISFYLEDSSINVYQDLCIYYEVIFDLFILIEFL